MYAITINKEVMDLRKQAGYMEALVGGKWEEKGSKQLKGGWKCLASHLLPPSILSCLGSLTGVCLVSSLSTFCAAQLSHSVSSPSSLRMLEAGGH